MPIKATELKRNDTILWEGQLHTVLETEHVKPGKGPAYVQAKMKNLQTGTIKFNRINSSDRVEDVSLERRPMQFLYEVGGRGSPDSPGGPFVFMDSQTFDQVEVGPDILPREQSQWLRENVEIVMHLHDGRPLSIEMPPVVELAVTETAPQHRGATATNQSKEAVVETGARIRVPPFIEVGQVVRISPETGEYLGKA